MTCPSIECQCVVCVKRERALDVQASLFALKNCRDDDDLQDKLSAIAVAVKRRRTPLAVLLGVLLCFGCSAAGSVAPSDVTFRVEGEQAYSVFYEAAQRLLDGAGVLPLDLQDGTVPITFVEQPDGVTACAQTIVRYHNNHGDKPNTFVGARIEVFVPAPARCFQDTSLTLAHEMIHAIRAAHGLNLADVNAGHSADGFFMATANDERFSESTRAALCEAADCL